MYDDRSADQPLLGIRLLRHVGIRSHRDAGPPSRPNRRIVPL